MPRVVFAFSGMGPWPREFEEREVERLRAVGFQVYEVENPGRAIDTVEVIARTGGRLDAVVLTDTLAFDYGTSLGVAKAIRALPESLSYGRQVRARTTPIVLLQVYLGRDDIVIPWEWCVTAFKQVGSDEPSDLPDSLGRVIRSWREALLRELDYIGYAITLDASDALRVGHALIRARRESELLLDEATPAGLRAQRTYILSADVLEDAAPLHELEFLLENHMALARHQHTKSEELFQRFFEQYPHMLYRDAFVSHWARPRLLVPTTGRYLVPDFVLRPISGDWLGSNWEVMELKRPDVSLLERTTFHRTLSRALLKAIGQLRDYRDYFNRDDTREELRGKFGFAPRNPRLAVLIGRRVQPEDAQTLAGGQGVMATLDVSLVTYDDLLDFDRRRLEAAFDIFER